MRKLRRIALSLVLAVALVVAFTAPAFAQNPTVSISVKARLIAITNSQDTWDMGVVAIDGVKYFSADNAQDDDYSRITNTGSVAVDVEIQGTDLTGTPTWTLATSVGADTYTLYANKELTPTVYDVEVKKASYADIVTGLAAAGTNDWSMKFTAPSSFGGTENGATKSGTVTLVASAAA